MSKKKTAEYMESDKYGSFEDRSTSFFNCMLCNSPLGVEVEPMEEKTYSQAIHISYKIHPCEHCVDLRVGAEKSDLLELRKALEKLKIM